MESGTAWDFKGLRIDNQELRRRLRAVETAGLGPHPSDTERARAMLMAIGLSYEAIEPANRQKVEATDRTELEGTRSEARFLHDQLQRARTETEQYRKWRDEWAEIAYQRSLERDAAQAALEGARKAADEWHYKAHEYKKQLSSLRGQEHGSR